MRYNRKKISDDERYLIAYDDTKGIHKVKYFFSIKDRYDIFDAQAEIEDALE